MKILATDYDSTLNYGGFPHEKLAAIKRWQAAGNLFGIISGRGMYKLLDVQKQDGIACDFLIGNNGAQVYTGDGKILNETRCDGNLCAPLIKRIFEFGGHYCHVNAEKHFVVVKEFSEPCDDAVFTLEDMPDAKYFTSIGVVFDTYERAAEAAEILEREFKDSISALYHGGCVEIVPVGINKAVGIYHLIEALGLTYDDVIVIGDHLNDIEMIKEFYSYAMENGVNEVKALADHITPGVTELIEAELNK